MTRTTRLVGIDVSKRRLDVALPAEGIAFSAPNDPGGWQTILDAAAAWHDPTFGLEASGGYERGIAAALRNAGHRTLVVEATRVRHYARARGRRAKNDRIDAAMIAGFLATLPADERQTESPQDGPLHELCRYRQQLAEERTRIANQVEHLASERLRAMSAERIAALKAQLAEVERAILAAIERDPVMARKADLLRSSPGVGPATAAALLCWMPELGSLDRRQAAALAGLAPFDRDSGGWHGKRSIAGGRADVRRALYMATLVGVRWNPALERFYRRLRDAGKPAKLALTACMRKLLTTLNAMLRSGTPWMETDQPSPAAAAAQAVAA